jgi:hypothetical protein
MTVFYKGLRVEWDKATWASPCKYFALNHGQGCRLGDGRKLHDTGPYSEP